MRDAGSRSFWSLIVPGVGQFMNGQAAKGALMMAINVGTNVATMNAETPEDATPYFTVNLANGIWSAVDAYNVANELNRTAPLGVPYRMTDAGVARDGACELAPLLVVLDPFSRTAGAFVQYRF